MYGKDSEQGNINYTCTIYVQYIEKAVLPDKSTVTRYVCTVYSLLFNDWQLLIHS